jgi:Ala-tRNA(Pro) deacylase
MIPAKIESHLKDRFSAFEHHRHAIAMTAQELAASEHISGYRVAKAVVVRLDGRIALAVVAATDRVALGVLEEATAASQAELVPEQDFAGRFLPCEPGAEPPLALFGFPIFVDEKLLHEKRLLMPGGTHEDAIALDTHEWIRTEEVQPIANLGIRFGEHRA